MASKDYPKPEEPANQPNQQALAAEPAGDSRQLFATLTQVFETFQEHLQRQLQNQPTRQFDANAQAAASVFNNIVMGLQLKLNPDLKSAKPLSPTEIELVWEWTDDITDKAAGFRIWRCEGQGCQNFAEINTRPSNARVYSDVNLSSGKIYRYKVSAFNESGETFSHIAEATTLTT